MVRDVEWWLPMITPGANLRGRELTWNRTFEAGHAVGPPLQFYLLSPTLLYPIELRNARRDGQREDLHASWKTPKT